MKEIKAYLRVERLEPVVHALQDAGVERMTVLHVRSLREAGDAPVSIEAGAHFLEHVKLEIVCGAPVAERLVTIVRKAARTGAPGDGIVYVSEVERAVKIRTGAEGREALS